MATDLSQIQQRTTQQDRITRNRDALIRRNDTSAPDRKYQQDIRNAARGDGGAEDLRRTLGLVQDAAGDFQKYAAGKFEKEEEKLGGQGAIDAFTGTVDPELIERSAAYRTNVSLGRAKVAWAEGLPDFAQGLEQLIADQADPDPLKREAEINEYIDNRYRTFALDENGDLKDFGSPQANRWLAEQMTSSRAEARATAKVKVTERLNTESVENAARSTAALLRAGKDISWGEFSADILPSVDPKAAASTYVTTIKVAALEIEKTDPVRAIRLLDGLLAKGPGPGLAAPAVAPAGAPAAAPAAGLVRPFTGFDPANVRSKIGAARDGGKRSHNGEDFPAPVGTPVVAPMGGTVVGSYFGKTGGHQVRVKLDNGAIVGFAHLNNRSVKQGSRIEAGQPVGASGNTGKSSGPHVHMTVEVDGQKVSPSEYFAGQATAAAPTTAAADPSVFDPTKPSELADAAGGVSGLALPAGNLDLTVEQRADILEYRRNLKTRADTAAKQAMAEDQDANTGSFISRLAGVGAYPTKAEVQEAIRTGTISPQQGMSIVNTIDSDVRQARADANSAVGEGEKWSTEQKRNTVDTLTNRITAEVYMGRETPTGARNRIYQEALKIPDRETRQAFVNGALQELNDIAGMRTKGPAYAQAEDTLTNWESAYVNQLAKTQLPKGATKEQAAALIRGWMAPFAAKLGRGDIPADKVPAYLQSAEKWLDAQFARTFPPRPVPRSK